MLDTHALVWWANGNDQLSPPARKAIETELSVGGQILVSAITAWEIAMLVAKGRLVLTMDIDDWLATVESIEGVSFVPLEPDVAMQSVRLPGEFHPDLGARIIVALARHHWLPQMRKSRPISMSKRSGKKYTPTGNSCPQYDPRE